MWSIILRDIKLAIRSGGGFSLTLAFFLIVIMIVPFGVGANLDLLSRIAPGLLWIGALPVSYTHLTLPTNREV